MRKSMTTISYHMKEGGRHDFNAVWEFCYHALQFFFPANEASAIRSVNRKSAATGRAYTLGGMLAFGGRGIQIIDSKKIIK